LASTGLLERGRFYGPASMGPPRRVRFYRPASTGPFISKNITLAASWAGRVVVRAGPGAVDALAAGSVAGTAPGFVVRARRRHAPGTFRGVDTEPWGAQHVSRYGCGPVGSEHGRTAAPACCDRKDRTAPPALER